MAFVKGLAYGKCSQMCSLPFPRILYLASSSRLSALPGLQVKGSSDDLQRVLAISNGNATLSTRSPGSHSSHVSAVLGSSFLFNSRCLLSSAQLIVPSPVSHQAIPWCSTSAGAQPLLPPSTAAP